MARLGGIALLASAAGTADAAVAGRYAAFSTSACDRCTGNCATDGVWLVDLRRRMLSNVPGPGQGNFPLDIELRANGALAYTARRDRELTSVWLRHSGGAVDLLDAGRDIDPLSLERSGTTVSWLRAGERRSAQIV